MFFRSSYKEPEKEKQLNNLVGPAYSFWYRLTHKSIGSSFLRVHEFRNFTFESNTIIREEFKKVVIELRPKGIVVHFKIGHETYLWGIPYYQLHLYSSDFFSIHAQGKAVFVRKDAKYLKNKVFLKELVRLKDDFLKF